MKIIHLDEHILVIDKPAGLPVLPDGWEKDAPYLVKTLTEEYGRIWVVHRLDKVTSGVMVLARTAEAHRDLNIQFEKHEAEKVYRAIMVGNPPWEAKTTKFPLRGNVGHSHRTMVDDRHGKPAETGFKVIQRGSENTLVEARPMTGRTHQVRVHAYALGYPLLGDTLYSAPETRLIRRPALHAYSLKIRHPQSGESMIFSAPYPEDFAAAVESLNKP